MMQRFWRNDADHAGTCDLCLARDGDFEFAFDNMPHFFLLVRMGVQFSALIEDVMSEGHAGRIEIAPVPAGLSLDDIQLARVDDRHWPAPDDGANLTTPPKRAQAEQTSGLTHPARRRAHCPE